MAKLGRLEKVDLRTAWCDEAADFTPWLASEENLGLLGDTIGMDLELEAQEKDVGPFRADIVCRDTATDTWVLIENQLERTDHIHLGQLLTYAAGLDAVTIVWIAARFTDEHRAAMDWLNEKTTEEVSFFGLEIELWRIGESPIAPKFNIVAKPNEWTKAGNSAKASNQDLTDAQKLQLEYWTAFREHMIEQGSRIKPQTPRPQHWMNAAIGRSRFGLGVLMNTQRNRIGVSLEMTGPDAVAHFELLSSQSAEIEQELGHALDWDNAPDNRSRLVRFFKEGQDPADRKTWKSQHSFLLNELEAFHRVFCPKVKRLNADEWRDNHGQ